MSTITVLPDRLARFLSEDFKLRSGKGKGVNGEVDACAVQAADWLAGGDGSTDSPECVCAVIREYVIYLNDSGLFAAHRDELKEVIPLIVGTAAELSVTVKRADICVRFAKFATESAEATKYAESSAKYAESAAKFAAKYAAGAAKFAAEYAALAAESAAEYAAEFAAEYAAEFATEYAADIRAACIQCIKDMAACS